MSSPSRESDSCRSCGSRRLTQWLSLGDAPLSDGFRSLEDLGQPEAVFPLNLLFCHDCGLVQISRVISPELMFGQEYRYFSSMSQSLVTHALENVEARIREREVGPDSQVVEIASNDGYLLQHYLNRGIPVLGIDPAPGPSAAARALGIPTVSDFFGAELAERLVNEGLSADIIHGNNVLAHVPDLNGFVSGLEKLLSPDGQIVLEIPYLGDLIQFVEFDTIYHEHQCYFSISSLCPLFARHGLFLNRVERLWIHGGSVRLFVDRKDQPSTEVREMLREEAELGMGRLDFFLGFGEKVRSLAAAIKRTIGEIKADGRTVAAYGAAAKGTMLLNAAGLGSREIDFVVDRNPHKQGKFMPGSEIPILEPGALLEKNPDFLLILPWNFKEEIMAQQEAFKEGGGRFIIPIPEVSIT
jgi:SAM-dependent methyltransferase